MGNKIAPVKRTGSSSGFHWTNLFQLCPRKFYFRYQLKWRPKFLPVELVQGSAFHEGKAAWYLTKSKPKALAMAQRVIDESETELQDPVQVDWLRRRIEPYLTGWIDSFGRRDLEEFKVVAVERELKVPIGASGFVFTIRPDTILQSKATGLVHIMETKTSGFSKLITEQAVYYGDQATAYIWGVQKVMGLEVYGVQPDIAYWNKRSVDLNNRDYVRTPMVFRDQYQLDMFEASVLQLFTEITQKSAALVAGYQPEVLFPRNSFYCVAYGKPCEYAMYCGKKVHEFKKIPDEFVKERSVGKPGDLIADSLSIQG